MNAPQPSPNDLVSELGRAEAALGRDDAETANVAMSAAADVCLRLQAAHIDVPAPELAVLRTLAERCALALDRLRLRLNAESLRDDNHRRGVETYLAASRR
jgi:hypothetical protein